MTTRAPRESWWMDDQPRLYEAGYSRFRPISAAVVRATDPRFEGVGGAVKPDSEVIEDLRNYWRHFIKW